ncbi:MAG: hypothetical protein JXN65_06590 [Clostridia bacterium]|nr:hypothetical protein [Clostridia bacterium]
MNKLVKILDIDKMIETLIKEISLYNEISISEEVYNELIQGNGIHFNMKLNDYCENCQREWIFTSWGAEIFNLIDNEDKLIINNSICDNCGYNHIFIYLLRKTKIIKIGQYPPYSKKEVLKVLKYKNIIKKYYAELTSSINLYSFGYYIASFVHLRRILEHLVNEKYNNLPIKNDEYKFIDKLKAVEKIEIVIPAEIISVKSQIYSVLSKGVHEYNEEECKNLYPYVKLIIELVLEHEWQKK